MPLSAYIPSAEAAYIADVSDKQLQRLYDEQVLGDPFVRNHNGRSFARISAAFAKFYFDLDADLTASARRSVIAQVCARVLARPDADALMGLNCQPSVMDWGVGFKNFDIGLAPFVAQAQERAAHIANTDQYISQDFDTMGGQPVLIGTRLPVDTLMALHLGGRTLAQLQTDYPSLTQAQLDAASVYQAIHPRRGRPSLARTTPPDWQLRSRRVLRPAVDTKKSAVAA